MYGNIKLGCILWIAVGLLLTVILGMFSAGGALLFLIVGIIPPALILLKNGYISKMLCAILIGCGAICILIAPIKNSIKDAQERAQREEYLTNKILEEAEEMGLKNCVLTLKPATSNKKGKYNATLEVSNIDQDMYPDLVKIQKKCNDAIIKYVCGSDTYTVTSWESVEKNNSEVWKKPKDTTTQSKSGNSSSSSSKPKCSICDAPAVDAFVGQNGSTVWYCREHYNAMEPNYLDIYENFDTWLHE